MNFVFISPNFPVRYFKWVEALRDHGVNVLGIGDSPYYETHDRLKAALREYYFVGDMSNYDNMYRAVAYFEKKYGKIDFRDRYKLSLITIRRNTEEWNGQKKQHVLGVPDTKTIILESDVLVLFGKNKDIEKFVEINN